MTTVEQLKEVEAEKGEVISGKLVGQQYTNSAESGCEWQREKQFLAREAKSLV